MNEDGSVEESYLFNSEFQLKKKDYIWQNKYKPRKPRFFNRVHTVGVLHHTVGVLHHLMCIMCKFSKDAIFTKDSAFVKF